MKKLTYIFAGLIVLQQTGATSSPNQQPSSKPKNAPIAADIQDKDEVAIPKNSPNRSRLRAIFGVTVGNAAVTVPENRNKQGVDVKKSSTIGGAMLALEYVVPVSPCFAIGIEGGAYIGQNKAKARVGTYYGANSVELQRLTASARNFFAVMAHNIAIAVADANIIGGGIGAIDAGVFRNFAQVMRYIGGSAEHVDANFLNNPAHADHIFDTILGNAPNVAATWANFWEEGRSADLLEPFGGATMDGLNQLREFITTYYPGAATFLQSFYLGIPGGADVSPASSRLLAEIFSGNYAILFPRIGGILADFSTMTADGIDAALQAFRSGTLAEIRNSAGNGRPTFGVCPYLAMKLRYYLTNLDSTVYLKAGFIRQSGVANFDNGIAPKSFHKISALLGIGFEKNLKNKWSAALEVLRILKTKSDIGSIRIFRQDVSQKVKLQDTRVSILLIYNI
jgi:hypothetical protein